MSGAAPHADDARRRANTHVEGPIPFNPRPEDGSGETEERDADGECVGVGARVVPIGDPHLVHCRSRRRCRRGQDRAGQGEGTRQHHDGAAGGSGTAVCARGDDYRRGVGYALLLLKMDQE